MITTKETTHGFWGGKKAKKQESAEPEDVQEDATPDPAEDNADDRRANGPFDVSEVSSRDGYVDLGALLIAPRDGLQLRLEVEEATQRVVAVTMDLEGRACSCRHLPRPVPKGSGRRSGSRSGSL
jgi:hypothetical protein